MPIARSPRCEATARPWSTADRSGHSSRARPLTPPSGSDTVGATDAAPNRAASTVDPRCKRSADGRTRTRARWHARCSSTDEEGISMAMTQAPVRDDSALASDEDLDRAPDGVPHSVVGYTALFSVMLAMLVGVMFVTG